MRWTLRRLVMLAAAMALMLFLMEQYIEPTIDNSLRPLRQMVSARGCLAACEWGERVGLRAA